MTAGKMIKTVWAGAVAGLFLGFFLKAIENLTQLKVYTLLLNVDYVPFLNLFQISESGEFAIHLVISILLSIILSSFLSKVGWSVHRQTTFIFSLSLIIGLLLFPTTTLSERTPELTDFQSLSYWILAHALYGLVLSLLLVNRKRQE